MGAVETPSGKGAPDEQYPVGSVLVARRLRPQDMRKRWARFNRSSARSIYDAAIDLRGLILKGCQFLGARADVLPREYVDVLAKLQELDRAGAEVDADQSNRR